MQDKENNNGGNTLILLAIMVIAGGVVKVAMNTSEAKKDIKRGTDAIVEAKDDVKTTSKKVTNAMAGMETVGGLSKWFHWS